MLILDLIFCMTEFQFFFLPEVLTEDDRWE